MPIYGYICRKCQNNFELLRGYVQKDDAAPCPRCGSTATARKIGNVNMVGAGARSTGGCGSCSSAGSNACSSCRSR